MQALCTPEIYHPHDRKKESAIWLQVLSHVDPRYGGIASSVPQHARATEAYGAHECPLASFSDQREYLPRQERVPANQYSAGRVRWALDYDLRTRFRETIRLVQGVHIHGVWEPHCNTAAAAARACGKPYIISAHGMLEPWALRQKCLKKALYAALIEARNLQRAGCLHALTADEVQDYRRVGLTNPVAVVPNGVDVPQAATGHLFWETYPDLAGKRVILFLGRIHRKKGLDLLLQAWARTFRRSDDVHVFIAGPDDGNLPRLQLLVETLGLKRSVTFSGFLRGALKWSALRAASLFVLTSYSEGFSVAILEAMGMGLPVIITEQCHFPEVAQNDCGWTVQPEVQQVEQALGQFLQLRPEDAVRMGERGRDLVERRFKRSIVGKQMSDVYDWLQGGSKPRAVEIV